MATAELVSLSGAGFGPSGFGGVQGLSTVYAKSVTAPCTLPASAAILVNGATNPPTAQLTMGQTAPLLSAGGPVLSCYATAQALQANSLMVARPSIPSLSLATPVGSCAGCNGVAAHTQVALADAIACPTITAGSQVQTWLAGLTGVVGATAVAAATATATTPGTGFTLNGTIGAIYGYRVEYA